MNLNKKEKTILNLLAQGYDNATLAEILGVSQDVIKDMLDKLYNKLSVTNRVQAVIYAIQSEIV